MAANLEGAQHPDQRVQLLFDFAAEQRAGLRANAGESERARRVSINTMRQLEELGALKLLLPKQLGGLELPPALFVGLLERLAEGDAAVGWCVMTGATTGLLSAYMPAAGARAIWTPGAITAGVFAPAGTATRAPGGYRVSGRWPFMSGCENATWCMGGARLAEPDNEPELINVFFPSGDGTRHDTWSTLGLRGTGSHDVEVSDLFVPESHVARVLNAQPLYTSPLFAFPLFGLLSAGIAGVALGIARAALEDLAGVLRAKRVPGGRPATSQGYVQLEYARAEAELEAGRALLLATCERLYQAEGQAVAPRDAAGKRSAQGLVPEHRARLRVAANQAVRGAVLAVDAAYAAAGGSAVYTRAPFEKHFRDIHTLTQHVMVQPSSSRLAGAVMLGADVDSAQL